MFFLFNQFYQLCYVDPYYFYIFLFIELGEIDGMNASNVVQFGACLVLQCYGWAGMAWSALGGGNEAAALYSTRGGWM